jgi:hypothetical protein
LIRWRLCFGIWHRFTACSWSSLKIPN